MESTAFRIVLVTSILVLFHLLCFTNAVPVTRIGNLMDEPQLLENTHLVIAETSLEEKTISRRTAVELNDYPGSGANNRHTPRQQFGRGCVDC